MRYIIPLLLIFLSAPSVTFAGFREYFEKEFLTKPWAGGQAEVDVCIDCHSSSKVNLKLRNITDAWKESWHSRNNVSCHSCHGGDPVDTEISAPHKSGVIATPKYADVPESCGKCHIGILKSFYESGHKRGFKLSAKWPNCVTCHGSHNIQKASINIISKQLCSKCHAYEKAEAIKNALIIPEKKIGGIERDINTLKSEGIFTEDEEKTLFRAHAEFRSLFHTLDVNLVKERAGEFTKRFDLLEGKIQGIFKELTFRKRFSVFLMLFFLGMGIVIFMIEKTYRG